MVQSNLQVSQHRTQQMIDGLTSILEHLERANAEPRVLADAFAAREHFRAGLTTLGRLEQSLTGPLATYGRDLSAAERRTA